MTPRPVPGVEPRIETGAVCFGTDWPGFFLRGDSCIQWEQSLRTAADELGRRSPVLAASLRDMANDLATVQA